MAEEIDTVPPKAAQANAKRGLELRKEWGRGGTAIGVARARDISNGKNLSRETIARMSAFNRHRDNYKPDKKEPDGGPTAGTIAWLLWGGTQGIDWAQRKLDEIDNAKDGKTSEENMEIKQLPFEMEIKAEDDGTRTIEGFGSVFNNQDSYKDIVMPGAFAKTLKKRKPAMLWQHKSDEPIGVWDEVEEQEKGLYMKGRIFDTTKGNDAYKLAVGKAVTGLSIGFTVKKDEYDQDKNTRKLIELDLYEVSLVTFPANERAKIMRVKSEDGTLPDERTFEEFLRDAGGFSRKEAKAIISDGYRAILGQRDAEADELKTMRDIAELFNSIKL